MPPSHCSNSPARFVVSLEKATTGAKHAYCSAVLALGAEKTGRLSDSSAVLASYLATSEQVDFSVAAVSVVELVSAADLAETQEP